MLEIEICWIDVVETGCGWDLHSVVVVGSSGGPTLHLAIICWLSPTTAAAPPAAASHTHTAAASALTVLGL